MSTQLIHIVGPACQARQWLLHNLINILTASGVTGALVDVLDAAIYDNAALRNSDTLGGIAIVIAETAGARHADLVGQDVVLRLEISPQAAELAAEVLRLEEHLSTAECAYVIEQARR